MTVTIGSTRLFERVVVLVVVAEQRLQLELGLLAGLDEQHIGTERLGDQLDHLVGERLRARDHLACVEQQPHEVGRRAIQLRRELLDRDSTLDDDLVFGNGRVTGRELRHRGRAEILEVATTPLSPTRTLALRAGTPTSGTAAARTTTAARTATSTRTSGARAGTTTAEAAAAAPARTATAARTGRETAAATAAPTGSGGTRCSPGTWRAR